MGFIRFTLSLVTFLYMSHAFACDCVSWASIQQLAAQEGTLVAKVRTVSRHGRANLPHAHLQIQKVYKGKVPGKSLKVEVGDGGTCAGDVESRRLKSWIAVIESHNEEEGGRDTNTVTYAMAMCGDSSAIFDSNGKIQLPIGDTTTPLTEKEFIDYLAFKTHPKVSNISCQAYASRSVANTSDSHPLDVRFNEWIESGYDVFSLEQSFEVGGDPRLSPLVVKAQATRKTSLVYDLAVSLTDPFTGVTRSETFEYDLKNEYNDAGVEMSSDSVIDGEKTWQFSSASCSINQTPPLVKAE